MKDSHDNFWREDAPSGRLSNGSPIATNFGVARVVDHPDRVGEISDALARIQEARGSSEVVLKRQDINEELQDGENLTQREVEALFICFIENGVATVENPSHRYVDYSFQVNIPPALKLLDQQRLAAHAVSELPGTEATTSIDLVATLPDTVSIPQDQAITTTIARVRELLLDADESVRLANPYFDPEQSVTADLGSLPNTGVDTRILTRETDDPNDDLRSTLNSLYTACSPAGRENLEVRDLYEETKHGYQAFATHAKIVVIDESHCYVGSANLTRHSLTSNFEFGVLLSGTVVEDVIQVFDAVFDAASPVTLPLGPVEE
jgi:cardiolipin synthase/putative cardiolipin synthase